MTANQMNEIKRHFNVVAESLHHEIRLIAEGHTTIERMVTKHRAETRQDKRELQSMIQTVHDSLKEDIRELSAKSDSHNDRITRLEKRSAEWGFFYSKAGTERGRVGKCLSCRGCRRVAKRHSLSRNLGGGSDRQ